MYVPEASRPHQWQTDEEGVRTGKCSFPVKVKSNVCDSLSGGGGGGEEFSMIAHRMRNPMNQGNSKSLRGLDLKKKENKRVFQN